MKFIITSHIVLGILLTATLASAQSPCGGMTKEKAASILGIPAEELEYNFSDQMHTCSFRKGWRHSINYALYEEKNAEAAKRSMNEVATGLQVLVKCSKVDGIGDAAISCHGERAKRLLVRKGATWVDIITPADIKQKKQVARTVLQ